MQYQCFSALVNVEGFVLITIFSCVCSGLQLSCHVQFSFVMSFSFLRMQTASDLPMAMRYRSLQKMYKQHVGVFQSDIHGLGLYCTRDIEPGEMVIEYAGTVIRSVLTDIREKLYDSKVRVCRL